MCASLFLCPLKRVVRVTSPASLSFAPASPTPLRGLRLSPAYRPGCTLCVVESFWRGQPRSRARPCSRAPPLLSTLQGSAPVEPATVPHAGHWVPALPWDALRPSGFAASGSAAAASPHSGPHLFEDLSPVCTGDARFSQRDGRRSARAFVNRLCCCRWTLPSQPPPTVESAVIPPISCPA